MRPLLVSVSAGLLASAILVLAGLPVGAGVGFGLTIAAIGVGHQAHLAGSRHG